LRKLDLAYALNAYAAQGVTTRHGIVVIDSTETRLASSRTMAVALTRIADQPRLVIDSAPRLERAALRNSAEKLSALEVLGKAGKDDLPKGVHEPVGGRCEPPSRFSARRSGFGTMLCAFPAAWGRASRPRAIPSSAKISRRSGWSWGCDGVKNFPFGKNEGNLSHLQAHSSRSVRSVLEIPSYPCNLPVR
jgi:hypothetical protein